MENIEGKKGQMNAQICVRCKNRYDTVGWYVFCQQEGSVDVGCRSIDSNVS